MDFDGLALSGVLDIAEDSIRGIEFVALDVALGGEEVLGVATDLEVDVRGAARVGDGFDGAEVVFTGGAGEEASVALEVGVAFGLVAVLGVAVDAIAVGLPDFDQGIADGVATVVEEAPAEVGDLADGWGEGIVEDEKVVVGIEGEMIGVEGAFRLGGGLGEFIGEGSGDGEPGGGGQEGAMDEGTPGWIRSVHGEGKGFWCFGQYAGVGREARGKREARRVVPRTRHGSWQLGAGGQALRARSFDSRRMPVPLGSSIRDDDGLYGGGAMTCEFSELALGGAESRARGGKR